jgi:hypothetical protein
MHRGEFQPPSTSGPYLSHNGLGPNRAFLHKKLKPDRCTQGARLTCLEKHTPDTQISYGRSIFKSFTAPEDTDPTDLLECFDSRVTSPRKGSSTGQRVLIARHVGPLKVRLRLRRTLSLDAPALRREQKCRTA